MKIAVVKQKGGTGASALATTLAVELSKIGDCLLVDLDPNQKTSAKHLETRLNSNINPTKHSMHYKVINDGKKAIKASNNYIHAIYDGAATASISTGIISQNSDLVLIPTGFSKDDLDPNINLAYELMEFGVDKNNIFIVFNNASGTYPEQREAFAYLKQTEIQFMFTVVKNRPCYRQALNSGKILTEVSFAGPRKKAQELVASILFFGGFDYEPA